MSRAYRVLGGPKHGELVELEATQNTLTCILPTEPVVASWYVGAADELFKTKMFVYEKSFFSFPHVMEDVVVLVPKGAKEAEREQYLINLITGRGFNGNW